MVFRRFPANTGPAPVNGGWGSGWLRRLPYADERPREFLQHLAFAGGQPSAMEGVRPAVTSANLTPSSSGIPYYSEELFLETIRTGRVRERPLSDLMPWAFYRT